MPYKESDLTPEIQRQVIEQSSCMPIIGGLREERGDDLELLSGIKEQVPFERIYRYMNKTHHLRIVNADTDGPPRITIHDRMMQYAQNQYYGGYALVERSFTRQEVSDAIQPHIESGSVRLAKRGEQHRLDGLFSDIVELEQATRARYIELIFADELFAGIEAASSLDDFEWCLGQLTDPRNLKGIFGRSHRIPDANLESTGRKKRKKLDTEIVGSALAFAKRQQDEEAEMPLIVAAAEIVAAKLVQIGSYNFAAADSEANTSKELKIASKDLKGSRRRLIKNIPEELQQILPDMSVQQIKETNHGDDFRSLFSCLVYKFIYDYRDEV